MNKLLKILVIIVCVAGGLLIGKSSHIQIEVLGVLEIQDILRFAVVSIFFTWLAWKHLFPTIDKKFPSDDQ